MRAIARSAALIAIAAVFACADAHDDVIEVVTSMAAALVDVNVPRFMAAFSKDMPGYETLENNVAALVDQAEVSSSIVPVSDDGNDQTRKMDLDWALQVRSLEQTGPIVQRREVIHCELHKEKKHWKVVALKPLDFFAPAKLAP
ncbi:MAG: hypothetical protein JOZ32_18540 [Bryobacterales bacterium]|nr:hypothetical protein [Bryobacterales bacterium]